MNIDFTFSDLIAGYVKKYDQASDSFDVETSDGPFTIKFGVNCYGELMRNLGEPYHDCTGQMRDMLVPGATSTPTASSTPSAAHVFEAQASGLRGPHRAEYLFETPGLVGQADRALGDFYLQAQFGDGPVDYAQLSHRPSS